MKKNIALILIAVLVISMTACGGGVEEPAESGQTVLCYITIEDYCTDKEVEVKENASVYDVLQVSGAEVSSRKSTYGIYVEGINGRFEFDEGPGSGWVYTVNDSRTSASCSEYIVSEGDHIDWTYVTEI